MRLLHAGDGDELRRAVGEESESDARRGEAGGARQPLPLRHLSKGLFGDAGRGAGDADRGGEMSADEAKETASATRKERFLHGVGVNAFLERNVPLDEPPPWPDNDQLAKVGKPTARLDGRAKATGAARYPSDIQLPGMLYARMVVSPHPHARVLSIDTAAAERHPGVRAVHVLDRVLGNAELTDPSKEIASKFPIVRFAGQPVAAVAAITPAAALEAAAKIAVEYEPLPFVVDLDEARRADAPRVFP